MLRWALVLLAIAGMMGVGAPAEAGRYNWSIGYSDYGRHGGYSVEFGRFGGQRYNAVTWQSPSWYGAGWGDYGYRDTWSDPWYLGSYRAPLSYGYRNCYYGCGAVRYGHTASRYGRYGYSPRYYGYRYSPRYYAPSYGYRYSYGGNHGRYDRYDRHDRGYSRSNYGYPASGRRDGRYDNRGGPTTQ
jgi:hypothetical protein